MRRSAQPAPARRSRSLLIVEDHRHTRELYPEYLAFYGLKVRTAADGASALAEVATPERLAQEVQRLLDRT